MPAAAVIPAPVAYTNVAAVKKLVVGFLVVDFGPLYFADEYHFSTIILTGFSGFRVLSFFYFEKIRVFKAGLRNEYISME